ncbi:hypothetical protein [Pseudomonas putida]|uniref:hypothetical protein n=1 Tax=Pseudomonas putida TaxID=303 RepID=UPI0023666966|nr:hypothetical protein [Pseudomonas putida]MDD2048887.1 hypothetical protein [Pseudomonas putida]
MTENLPPSDDASYIDIDIGDSVPLVTIPADSWIAAGRGNALRNAEQQRQQAVKALHAVLEQAPRLRTTLRNHLQENLQVDPEACGLYAGDSQATLLSFAARVLSSAVFANPFVEWSTWGLAHDSRYAAWTGRDWVRALNPLLLSLLADSRAAYWDVRMPGHAVSRRAYTQRHLGEHLRSTIELNYGLDRISEKASRLGQLDSSSQYAQLFWNHPGDPAELCPTALLVKPQADDAPWLLYRPAANNPIRSFQNQAALLRWSYEHRQLLWPYLATPLDREADTSFVDVRDMAVDGLAGLLDSALEESDRLTEKYLLQAARESATDPLDWSPLEAWETRRGIHPKEELPEQLKEQLDLLVSADDTLAAEELHFDSLDERLPLGWRKQRIERQEKLLADYLGDEVDPTSAKMTGLRQRQSLLDNQTEALQKLLTDLPDSLDSETWGQTYGETSRFEQLSQHFAQDLLLEARFQHLLGDLAPSRLAWVEHLIERPEPSLQRPVVANAVKLVIGERSWALTGYLAVRATPEDDSEAFDSAWLLHKSGHFGGLSVFADQTQLNNALLKTLYGAWPETLLESAWPQDAQALLKHLDETTEVPSIVMVPITTHVFDYLTQTQLALFTRTASSALQTLQQNLAISTNQARVQAFERLAQRNRTAHIHTKMQSLTHLDDAQRAQLAAAFEALRVAMLSSSRLLQRDLPERGLFARNKLHERLRQSFSVPTLPDITLDIADRTFKQRVPLPESGMANAYKLVVAFSPERSDVPLEKFLLWALDEDLTMRLGNARILFGDNTPAQMRQQLTLSYIANLVKELDLAGAYERQIVDAFKGLTDGSQWAAQLRQETLRAPFEQQLSIINLSRSANLDEEGQHLLERFCQEQQDTALTTTIDYFTLELMPGVAADGSSNRVDLSGVCVLQAETGPVLLLLPDAPNEQVISQYDSTENACRALEEMAYTEAMRSYLASLPLEGDASDHLSYINTAVLQKYTGFIGLGSRRQEPWAQFQANLQMGQLIVENRTSSRSQRDLFLEQAAIRHGRVYDYIKMAMSLVPLVGTTIALYDGWNAANASVEAFLRGDAREGIEHLNSVFLSMVDALLDLTPGSLAANSNAVARTSTRQRTLSTGIPLATVTRRSPSDPFIGYEAEAPAGRWVDHPAAYGTGVVQHAESLSDYIVRHGRYFQVEWDETYRTWRLKGTHARTYKQPVKLSETGHWQTHGSLSGRIIDNGLAGGGAYLGTLYNRGWQTLRGYLRPQPARLSPVEVVSSIDTGRLAQQARLQLTTDALNRAHGFRADRTRGTPADPATIKRALQEATDQLQAFVTFHEQSLDRLHTIRSQVRPAQYRAIYDDLGINLGRQHPKLLQRRRTQMHNCFHDLDRLLQTFDEITNNPLEHLRQLQRIHEELTAALGRLEAEVRRIGHIRNRLQRNNLTIYDQDIAALDMPLDPHGYRIVRLSSLAAGIFKPPSVESYDFLLMLRRVNREVLELRSALFSHGDLAAAGLSRAETHRFLLQLKQRYQRFVNHMLSWQDIFPDFFTAETTRQMRQELASLINEVDGALSASSPSKKIAGNRGRSRPRLFETVDQQLLIGHEISVDGQPTMVVNRTVNSETHTSYTRAPNGKWQPARTASAAPSGPLTSLVASANKRLADVPGQRSKLQQYKGLNMLPADLEDLAQGYAATLRDLAQDIVRKSADDLTDALQTLVQRLEQAADELTTFGRQLRIEQIKASQQPGISHLQYLHTQEQVDIHWSRTLEPARNKQGNPIEYLEEYRIDDRSTGTPLWYAHFHFKNTPGKGFARLEAGHLKLASEVNQGSGAWRGPITESQATALFGGLRPNPG